ncbi:MAG: HAMP domain-containing histidine kinase [Ruminococcaceae bacterium]|nr:HAMP domain-containing histidine kinase [Oscillospiraceae bacterium]MBD5116763.1 HAMP domain-containing histidine kinase [Oscillospiraceae bacterium]
MLAVTVGVYFFTQNYYYNSVSQYLRSEANVIWGVLTRFYEDSSSDYSEEIRSTIESFDKKDIMELMAIDNRGNIAISSSGFSPDVEQEMPDYIEAVNSPDGIGEYVGSLNRSSVSEKYMAVSVILSLDTGSRGYSAIRVMTSLEGVEKQLMQLSLITAAAGAFVLVLVLIIGFYFIKSIITPIRKMVVSSRQLAKGNFSEHISFERNDEIGELCKAFNYMAEELANSEKIKNDFISSVSHELRTPLTAIKGWSETILEMRDAETLIKGMRVITTETERLSAMVEELLDFSRIQNNRLMLQKANTDILAELADAVLIYTERAAKNNIIINYHEPDGVAMIFGDKNRLRQVFLNIIDNAIKYIGKDGVVNVDAVLKENSIEIKVADNGCGISKEDLPKVKNRFYKANNTVRGSGIGLAVADELVSLHSGKLEIESVQGEGTTVTITLPTIQKKAE